MTFDQLFSNKVSDVRDETGPSQTLHAQMDIPWPVPPQCPLSLNSYETLVDGSQHMQPLPQVPKVTL